MESVGESTMVKGIGLHVMELVETGTISYVLALVSLLMETGSVRNVQKQHDIVQLLCYLHCDI